MTRALTERRISRTTAAIAAVLFALAATLVLSTAREASADERTLPGEVRDGGARSAGADPGTRSDGSGATRGTEASKTKKPESKMLHLSVPRLGLEDVWVPNSNSQAVLDEHGVMRLAGTGFPWEERSNTYLAGHAMGYAGSRVPRAFKDLDRLRDGDRIVLRDADDREYTYRVYKSFVVSPLDYWVTEPVKKENVVTLQTCWPAPTYEQRMIVRAELVE